MGRAEQCRRPACTSAGTPRVRTCDSSARSSSGKPQRLIIGPGPGRARLRPALARPVGALYSLSFMSDVSIHLAPNAPWVVLAVLTLLFAGLGLWAYGFAVPPLPPWSRRLLPALRVAALVVLAWLLAQPALERPSGGPQHLVVLVDRSRSMALPASPGGASRAADADRAVQAIRRAWRGRAAVDVMGFATTLGDSGGRGAPAGGATAL